MLQVLFIELVLISHGKPGSCDGASAGRHWLWYPGSCKPYALHIFHCSSVRTVPHTFLPAVHACAVVCAVAHGTRNKNPVLYSLGFTLIFHLVGDVRKMSSKCTWQKFFFSMDANNAKELFFVYRKLWWLYSGLRYICHLWWALCDDEESFSRPTSNIARLTWTLPVTTTTTGTSST